MGTTQYIHLYTLISSLASPSTVPRSVEKARIQAVPVRVQSPVVPEPPTSLRSDKKTPKPLVRGKVIQEMIETEREYHKEVTVFREHVVPFLREVSVHTGAAML